MCFAFALLTACDGSPGADDEIGADTDTGGETSADSILLGGRVQKGPLLLGSTVDVSRLDADGQPTGDVYRTKTINDLGEFWVSVPKSGPVSIEASGYYYNEVSGGLSTSWITLGAIYNANKNETNPILVNTITHLSYDRVRSLHGQGQSFANAIAIAEQELQVALGIGLPDLEIVEPGTSLDILGGDTPANAYLFAVSSVLARGGVTLAGGLDGTIDAHLQALMNQIAFDLADDGLIDAELRAKVDAAELALDTAAVEVALAAWLAELGSNAEVPDLDAVLDQDGDLLLNIDDNCARAANQDQADLDMDGVGDACENCLDVANPDQADSDQDGLGDACDVECGDSEVDADEEECDDGNLDDTDECTTLCQYAVCGDGIFQPVTGEQCDDGGEDGGECTSDCTFDVCGNGNLGPNEACDDGNYDDNDECTTSCQYAVCGDGYVAYDIGEECDDGNLDNDDECTSSCLYSVCGDGFVNPGWGEQCDDGNNIDDDDCTSWCELSICGDGNIQFDEGEECDDGNLINDDDCTALCKVPSCGDSIVQDGEACDDGNDDDDDACTHLCQPQACGDGIANEGDECEDGNMDNTDDCVGAQTCSIAVCGDGFFHAGVEECDDANMDDDDACTSACESNLAAPSTIFVGGGLNTRVKLALTSMNEPYASNNSWVDPYAADILIISDPGATAGPDYNAHLNSGKHVLMLGGNNSQTYKNWLDDYVSPGPFAGWHTTEDCSFDWTKGEPHPITAFLPAQQEFSDQFNLQHMVHFRDVGQPYGAKLLGRTCHQAPDNHVMIMRPYNNGGSFTYVVYDIGWSLGQNEFLIPLLEGYLDWVRQ
jgi:cysteine-rich repeat protein